MNASKREPRHRGMEDRRLTISRMAGILILGCLLVTHKVASAQERPPENAENVAIGKEIYRKRCSFCHGLEGDGNGPVADYLNPRPRDFTLAVYKLRTTKSGEVPLNEDLFRVLENGIPGTAMQSFDGALSETERWQVIYFIKTFAADFFADKPQRAEIGSDKSGSVEEGKKVYQKAKCWECHGQEGRGDGPSAAKLKDDWGFPIVPANLTKGWRYKGGNSVTDIFTRFTTGINGTPMPSYTDTLTEDERWDLAAYVRSLVRETRTGGEAVLRSVRVERALPSGPDDSLWQLAAPLEVPLSGQVVVRPRWQNHSVDLITVRSLYNDKAIAFLLEWDDPFKDSAHKEEPISGDDTYAKPDPERKWTLSDSVEIQFPVKITEGAEAPYFFLGQPDKPVSLWRWNAAGVDQTAGRGSVEELTATGSKKPAVLQGAENQELVGQGAWKDGRWRVVLTRPLAPREGEKDLAFEVGKIIPVAFHVWDGANGEREMLSAISSWVYLLLEPLESGWLYVYGLMGTVITGVGEWWLVKKMKRDKDGR